MSIGLAIIGNNCGVVCSDSIGVNMDTGELLPPQNKTFRLKSENIIGVHTGILNFNDITIPDHIKQILLLGEFQDFLSCVNLIKNELHNRFANSTIIGKIEVLLLSKRNFTNGSYEIYSIELDNTGNVITSKISISYINNGAYVHMGDDTARVHIEQFIKSRKKLIGISKVPQLRLIAQNAMITGIENCGRNPNFPDLPACCAPPCILTIA